MKTLEELKQFIASHHKPELALQPGMVWQIWEDGELTLQKSGELLWCRNLHCIKSGFNPLFPKDLMPVIHNSHSYAFIESELIGEAIRREMQDYVDSTREQIK